MKTSHRAGYAGCGCFALVLIVLAIALLAFVPGYINRKVVTTDFLGYDESKSNGTHRVYNEVTEKWIAPPYEMLLHVHMYNVENAAAYLAGTAKKINLTEKGPYTFTEWMNKVDLDFTLNDTRVFYRNNKYYRFNQSQSCSTCFLSDRVTIPNIVFQKLVDIAELNVLAKIAIESALKVETDETVFKTVTVDDALFNGFTDPLLEKLPEWIRKVLQVPNRIGFFYGQNATDDGLYEIGTGKEESQDLGHLYTFNHATSVNASFWDSPYARMINGTDGQLFPPLLKKDVELELFASQACRSVKLAYQGDAQYEGVQAWRYAPPQSMYDPTRPENQDFCHNDTVKFFDDPTVQLPGCLPAGLLDLSHCQPGNPRVYIGQAHFYQAPEQVRLAVDGVRAPTEKDATFVDLEPTSGVAVYAERVGQVNIGMKKGNLNMLAKIPGNVIVPVLWINETASFDSETRNQLLNQLQAAKKWTYIVGLAAAILGALLAMALILGFCFEWANGRKADDVEPLISENATQEGVGDTGTTGQYHPIDE